MTPEQHAALSTKVRQILLVESQTTAMSNQLAALKEDGVPDIALRDIKDARDALRRTAQRWKRQLGREWRDLPVMQWASTVHGLGDAVVLTLGTIPRLVDFANPAKLWKYGGLAPGMGPKKGENHKYSRDLKSFAIKRLAEPCVKQRESPYRAVYDMRRAHTELTHPEWSDGHHYNDALRITAKAILLDLWLVANNRNPRVGQPRTDSQNECAAPDSTHKPAGGQSRNDAHRALAPAGTQLTRQAA